MPALSEIRIEGAAQVDFTGFDEKHLDVIIEGAGQVKGTDSETGQLNATLKGLGQIDLGDVSAENATVALDGAGEIVVWMAGFKDWAVLFMRVKRLTRGSRLVG